MMITTFTGHAQQHYFDKDYSLHEISKWVTEFATQYIIQKLNYNFNSSHDSLDANNMHYAQNMKRNISSVELEKVIQKITLIYEKHNHAKLLQHITFTI